MKWSRRARTPLWSWHPVADDRRELYLERTGEVVKAPPSFMLVVSYNPGYQNLLKGYETQHPPAFRGDALRLSGASR